MRKPLAISLLAICISSLFGVVASAADYSSPSPDAVNNPTVVTVSERTLADERLEQASELRHYRWEWRQENYRLEHQTTQPIADEAISTEVKN